MKNQPVRLASPLRRPALGNVSSYIGLGCAVIATLTGGIGVWAASTELAGAVLATGSVVVDSHVKKVQHPTGGVIGAIYVKEGQQVRAGDLLVRLDETVSRSNLQLVLKQLDEIAVRQARLKAEQAGQSVVSYPEAIIARREEAMLSAILLSETTLFENRRDARSGLRSQFQERIAQLNKEIEGLTAQEKSRRDEFKFATAELVGLEGLEGRNLVSTPRITAARRTVAQLEGDIAQVIASTAQARGKIAEIELQILQLDQELKTEVGRELRDEQKREAELSERRVAAEDELKRTEMLSPQTGIVHQLSVHTIGGVVTPSEQLMLIVPQADRLVVDAKVAPQDIDQVNVGQLAHVRFSAFNQRTTPDMTATVSRVSADLMVEFTRPNGEARSDGGAPYYSVRLTPTDETLGKLGALKVIPGMPVEIHIATGQRSALTYFTKPLTDQFARAFRER